MKRIFVIVLFTIFCLGTTVPEKSVQASDKELYNVHVTFTSNGSPVFNSKFTIQNLQEAYEKIKTGTITSHDVNSAAWQAVEQQKGAYISDIFGINPGIKNNSENTESILRNMYTSGAGALVDQLNGHAKDEPFHYPKNISRRYTDNSGRAEVATEAGINGVFDNDGNLVQLLRVKKNSANNFSVDINSTTNLFTGKITNLSSEMKANDNSYTVELGEPLTYQLTIDKSLLTEDLPLAINPQTNLIIDEISLPYTQVPAYGDIISLQTLGITSDNSINPNASLAVLKSEIQQKFYKNILWGYAVTIPKSEHDVTVTIKAHLASEVKFESNLQGATTDGSVTPMEFVVGDKDLIPDTLFSMNIVASTTTGTLDYSMPTIRTSGINFVSVNASGTGLESKNSYILGYEKGKQKYVYGENRWNPVTSLEDIDLSTVQTFSGGNQYYLGGTSIPIPVNTDLFSFDAKKNRKVNESLIKFLGLGQGKKYFLYPVEGKGLEKQELYFTVYNKDSRTLKGDITSQTSIGNAEYEDYSINNLIPDYRAGTTEYNAVMSEYKSHNPGIKIFVEIGGIVIVVIGVLVLIYKKE
ncbi:hypothetical protein ACQUEN_01150 [Lactococcus taiwanensis]|uniref:hypothetical protein n=1 Tax=Lactococcus taiwanensis TaxID=1151742 RepID=UPI003D0DFD8B